MNYIKKLLITVMCAISTIACADNIHMPSAEALAQRLRFAGFDENFIRESGIHATLGGREMLAAEVAQKIHEAIAMHGGADNIVATNLLMSDEAQAHFTEIIRQKYPDNDVDTTGDSITTTLTSAQIDDCIQTLKREHPEVSVAKTVHAGEEARSMLVDTLLSHNLDDADDVKRQWHKEQNKKTQLDAQIDKFNIQEDAIQTALQQEEERLKSEPLAPHEEPSVLAHNNDNYQQRLSAFYEKLTKWHKDLDHVLIDKHFNPQMAEKMHQVLNFKPAEYLHDVLNHNPFPASFADHLQQQLPQWNEMRNFAQMQAPIQPDLLRNFNFEQARQIQQTLNWHYEAPKTAPREFQGTPYEQLYLNQAQGNIGNGYYQDVMFNRPRRN